MHSLYFETGKRNYANCHRALHIINLETINTNGRIQLRQRYDFVFYGKIYLIINNMFYNPIPERGKTQSIVLLSCAIQVLVFEQICSTWIM